MTNNWVDYFYRIIKRKYCNINLLILRVVTQFINLKWFASHSDLRVIWLDPNLLYVHAICFDNVGPLLSWKIFEPAPNGTRNPRETEGPWILPVPLREDPKFWAVVTFSLSDIHLTGAHWLKYTFLHLIITESHKKVARLWNDNSETFVLCSQGHSPWPWSAAVRAHNTASN